MSQSLLPSTVTQMSPPMATIINNTAFVPALNGSLVNLDDCTNDICPVAFGEVTYIPSFGGNLAYLIIFAVFLVIQIVQGPIYRAWGFTVGLVCGLILEIIGYIGRLLLHSNDFDFSFFVIYLVCLTIAPAFISASIYLCLSRLVVVYGQNIARFSPKTYTALFVCCDIISLVLQAAGGGIAASSNNGSSASKAGVNIMIAGLSFQVASLTVFMVLGLDFVVAVYRARKSELNGSFATLRSRSVFRLLPWGTTELNLSPPLTSTDQIIAIALATITIFVRCCFRVAELKNGFDGKLANDQTAFMILEGPMIMIAVLSLTVFHPAFCFGGAQNWRSANWTWKTIPDRSSLRSDVALEEQKINDSGVQSDGSYR